MSTHGIPVLTAGGTSIAQAWENSLIKLHYFGGQIKTEYDKPDDPPSLDSTMLITIFQPLSEPMIHRDFPGGFEDLQEYVMEVCDGIKDHLVRDQNDPDDTRWEYTYHQRLCDYEVPSIGAYDQIEDIAEKLTKTPYSRRAQAVTWKVWEDRNCPDPACLQSVWCRITFGDDGEPLLNMNVRFRSNDAYKAAFMNIFALVMLQKRIADRITEMSGRKIGLGRYCHLADSYHIYGSNMEEFDERFLRAVEKRTFADRTFRYEDVKDIMEEARPKILHKARSMGRSKSKDEEIDAGIGYTYEGKE